jgi:hypothetical protein
MEARLTGRGFDIQPLTPEIQPVRESDPTEWRWEVVPNEPGSQALHLALSAVIYVADESQSFRVDNGQYYKTLDVRTTWSKRVSSFIANNWQWLWAAILVPVGAFLLPIVRKQFSKFVLKRRKGTFP